ncbi:hypothetical protein HAX54_028730 [Datura stramonium]|uniref:Uncharacterized protein n=1 Tax=Datura stramonium TaxID=4076 RepID=A0ABS8V5U4_DATST|nr:hypothetical protein [Datura stramonium]
MPNKGKEIVEVGEGLKRLHKGIKVSSSLAKGAPARRFRERGMEPHGLSWFNTQKEVKYAPENRIDEGRLTLEFPTIWHKVRTMMSRADQGKEVADDSKGLKRLRKGVASSTSSQKAPPNRRFGDKARGRTWAQVV